MKYLFLFLIGVVLGAGAFYYYGDQIRTRLPMDLPAQNESIAGVAYATDAWKVLQTGMVSGPEMDQYWGYSIAYPRDFEATPYSVFSSLRMSGLNSTQGWKIAFPRDAFADKKTNFSEAWMMIDFDASLAGEQCFEGSSELNTTALPDETINGATYKVFTVVGAAAGNTYDSKIYRAMVNSVCVEVSQTLHTGNIGNYDPGTVNEFGTEQTDAIFAKLFSGLTFTQINPNF